MGKKIVPGINECMMIGDQRKFNVAIITLKAIGANGETPGTDDLDPLAKNLVSDAVAQTNANNKVCLNPQFQIQKFTVMPHNFSEEQGELTPTKKLKRKKVEEMYATMIEKMYASTDPKEKYIQWV